MHILGLKGHTYLGISENKAFSMRFGLLSLSLLFEVGDGRSVWVQIPSWDAPADAGWTPLGAFPLQWCTVTVNQSRGLAHPKRHQGSATHVETLTKESNVCGVREWSDRRVATSSVLQRCGVHLTACVFFCFFPHCWCERELFWNRRRKNFDFKNNLCMYGLGLINMSYSKRHSAPLNK